MTSLHFARMNKLSHCGFLLLYFRSLVKEVETFQNKVEKKTGQSVVTQDENVCEICHKTKFTDGAGKECKYCKLKVCSRCGVQVSIPGSKQVYIHLNIYIIFRHSRLILHWGKMQFSAYIFINVDKFICLFVVIFEDFHFPMSILCH